MLQFFFFFSFSSLNDIMMEQRIKSIPCIGRIAKQCMTRRIFCVRLNLSISITMPSFQCPARYSGCFADSYFRFFLTNIQIYSCCNIPLLTLFQQIYQFSIGLQRHYPLTNTINSYIIETKAEVLSFIQCNSHPIYLMY